MSLSSIRVLLVDDSPIALAILKRILSSAPDIEVVDTALNGRDALNAIVELDPDIVCTDLHMPRMDGFELTKEIMARYARPILVVSTAVQEEDTENVFQLLDAGAVDVFPKPRGGLGLKSDYDALSEELINRIRQISTSFAEKSAASPPPTSTDLKREQPWAGAKTSLQMVLIGASTGGPRALKTILTQLPFDFPIPIVCIQHLSDGFLRGLVTWLTSKCKVKVKIAQEGEMPAARTIYFPPEGKHLEFDDQGRFVTSLARPFRGHRPSITITFQSAVDCYGSNVVGILLTGIGSDGVDGMKNIAKKSGITIVQDEATSAAFGMPKQVIDLGLAQYILPLDQIIPSLMQFLKNRT